jgi:peptidoglycan hydrolase CwlO-like protein
MRKIVIFIFLLLITIPSFVEAKSLNDYYNELAKLQAEYNANKNNKKLTEKQIAQINSDIKNINNSIIKIRADIKQAEADIEKSKEEIRAKKLETDGLIQFLQISNGGNIYLEYLFDAENYTDFIYRYEVVKQLTNYNSDLIDELENLILGLEKKEKELSEKQVSLENQRKELTGKLSALQYSLSSYNVEGTTLEDDIKDLKKQIKAYEDKGCSRYQDVSTCTASINALGWTYPLAKGCVTSEYTGSAIRDDWSGGGSHYGIDLSCVNEGTNVYPAADGVVARIVYKSSCGGNMVYITHNVKGKKYTTVYMHVLNITKGLYVGLIVTTKTVIGGVGGWSTWTKNGGYDRCTGGTHLHFGMAEGHNAFNFNTYAFNPREIFAFPKLIYSGGGYFYR